MDDYRELCRQLREKRMVDRNNLGEPVYEIDSVCVEAADVIVTLLAKLETATALVGQPDVFYGVEARLDELVKAVKERREQKDDYPPGPGPHRFA